ncbi:MAG TPA: diaminopimelate epimerase [Acidimicrobiales bacterium]|nr:diaminopimelate epimerase [Acidimicrobiales bacterium]
MTKIDLYKLHGAGNDFLVQVEGDNSVAPDIELFRRLCDRHAGVGGDGFIRVLPPISGGDIRMELHNADGSRAEMSGNGARCLVLAALVAGRVAGPEVKLETDAGLRLVRIDGELSHPEILVEMGEVTVDPSDLAMEGFVASRRAGVGNPHLVLVAGSRAQLAGLDLASLGAELDGAESGGLNVEVVSVEPALGGAQADGGAPASLDLRVWERGAGLTRACGTGSCAAAAVARSLGLVGDSVDVRNPGGLLTVSLSGPDPLAPTAMLGGPTRMIASLTVDTEDLRP